MERGRSVMFFSVHHEINPNKVSPLRVRSHIQQIDRKRTSQSAPKEQKFRAEDGGVTVEAAIIIPLLLCACVGILLWGKVFLIHQEIETALLETARQVARQEAVLSLHDQEGTGILSAAALFAANRKQGDKIGGIEVSSVNLIGSEYREETKEVYLRAEYVVKIPALLLGTWKLRLKTSVVQKAWNGYTQDVLGSGNSEYVYITAHGTSYHRDSQCYHLHVTIEEVTSTDDYYSGNTSYRACEYCVSGDRDKSILYISEDGECYHEDLSCGGLTRTVSYVAIGQTGGRRPCADCSGGG